MSNFTTRAISGAIFVAILVAGILYNSWSLKILFLVIAALGLNEFYTVVNIRKNKLLSVVIGVFVYLLFSQAVTITVSNIVIVSLSSIIFLLFELFDKNGSFEQGALRITGIMYIILPFILVSEFDGDVEKNAWLVLSMFIMIWANDTGAYLSGRAFGKNKLFERISPKKTIEGLIGGGITAILAALILSYCLEILPILYFIIMAFLVFVFANVGDLVESMLKRNNNIKDSGSIIPGHGGILDRFDAAIFTIPAVYLFLQLI